MKRYLLYTLIISIFSVFNILRVSSQKQTQTISGTILDKHSQSPIIGASIVLLESYPAMGTTSDADGRFIILNAPVGRIQLLVTYLGYAPYLTDALILNSAKSLDVQVELTADVLKLQEVVITTGNHHNQALNDFSLLSARSFSVDETQRYAASASDPGRMAMCFPGVQNSKDNSSDIVVHGNSGIGLQWKVEGIDILNPNHFPRRGSSVGGLTIFSISMLSNSDFISGTFPAEYGNAVSGIFDIKLRKGHSEKRQYSFRAGMLGLDFSTEGPFHKSKKSSYLINYRYSTLDLLNKAGLHLVGERTDNVFQDLAFHFHFPNKDHKRTLHLWGIGGVSKETEHPVSPSSAWISPADYRVIIDHSEVFSAGLGYTSQIHPAAFLKSTLAITYQNILYRNDSFDISLNAAHLSNEKYKELHVINHTYLSAKIGNLVTLKSGFQFKRLHYKLFRETIKDSIDINHTGNAYLGQVYVQTLIRPRQNLEIQFGLHHLRFTLNDRYSFEPRFSLKFKAHEKHQFSAGAGLYSMVLPLGHYFLIRQDSFVNQNLDLMKSFHNTVGYQFFWTEKLKLSMEIYYQYLYNIPVGQRDSSAWSILNTISGFTKEKLTNEGTGKNYGMDISIEKKFDGQLFLLSSMSLFRSTYTDAFNRNFSTVFDSRISGNFVAGKEWSLSNNTTLQLGLKYLYNGGQRLSPIRPEYIPHAYDLEPELNENRSFSEQVPDYHRADFRASVRINKKRIAWSLSLDIQNVLNTKNTDILKRKYDPVKNQWIYREQAGTTPLLMFQIDW